MNNTSSHKMSWDRASLKEYKDKCDEAIKNKQDSFVHKGALQNVNEAKRLIERFEKAFEKSHGANEVTLPYIQ